MFIQTQFIEGCGSLELKVLENVNVAYTCMTGDTNRGCNWAHMMRDYTGLSDYYEKTFVTLKNDIMSTNV